MNPNKIQGVEQEMVQSHPLKASAHTIIELGQLATSCKRGMHGMVFAGFNEHLDGDGRTDHAPEAAQNFPKTDLEAFVLA